MMMAVQVKLVLGKQRKRGFTLVELMIVVTIVGVMAVLGGVLLAGHVKQSRTHETLSMVQSIRAAQERWRSENLSYLNVSDSDTWFPRDPTATLGDQRMTFLRSATAHVDGANWLLLNPATSPFVYGGYQVHAGMAGTVMQPPLVAVPGMVWPTPTDSWYVIQAIMDMDMDGTRAFYLASSINGEIYRQDEGE